MESVLAELSKQRDRHLGWARDLCRFPSISTADEHKSDVRAAGEWLLKLCQDIGLQAELVETPGHPAVLAEYRVSADAPTYLVYGHYDVQPTGDLSLWDADPFEPVVKDDWLVCRGAADNKGQLLIYLRAAAAWLAVAKRLPVNLKFLFEGEEEIGSPHLAGLIEQHRERLACEHILISDTGLYADGWPTITYGTRGLLYKEIILTGPKHDLHSGSFGGTIANPTHVLADIIDSLHDEQGWVTIPGFYAKVAEISPVERAQLGELPFNRQEYLADLGAPELYGEAGYTTNERRWIRPTLDVNGVYGGFMGAGANTIIPARAGAKISMRLVPEQSAAALSAAFDKAIRNRCPDTVRLEIIDHGGADPYVAPLESAAMQAARRALEESFERPAALIREGGSLPILPMFRELLGADSLMLGFASPQRNAHGPNEKAWLKDLDRGAQSVARLLAYLGE